MNPYGIIIHKNQKCLQFKCPKTDEWINKMWNSHTMKYYSAIKNVEPKHAKMWINLENTMLSERSQSQRTIHLYESISMKRSQ